MFATKFFDVTYNKILKPFLFKLDPEDAHDLFTKIGSRMGNRGFCRYIVSLMFRYDSVFLEQDVAGIHFANPMGLSAGFDKDVKLADIIDPVGFGYIQVGSITHLPYQGNHKPRLRRLQNDKGLIVNYGLKNNGIEYAVDQLKSIKTGMPISISLAKTNCQQTVTVDEGIQDYIASLSLLEKYDVVDMYTLNISCPNTFGGEPFTTPELLHKLLRRVETLSPSKPVYIKMPVNLSWEEFKGLLDVIVQYSITGVIISNLVKSRDNLSESHNDMRGGVSGKPTQKKADQLIFDAYKEYHEKLIIIGVGGVFSPEDAYHKIKSGATLVQLITGMIFEGPQLIGKINKGLVKLAKKDGYNHISEAIGAYHR